MSTETWYPKAIRRPITTQEYWARRPHSLISIVSHITDGLDSRDYLQNANNGSSVNFLIREEGGVGVVYQFMPVEWAAWGNGIWSEENPYMPHWIYNLLPSLRANPPTDNINFYTVSIEHERKWPFTTTLPEAMKAATIDLQRWLSRTFPSIIVDRDHIIGHYQINHIDKANCPGGPGGKLFPFDDIIAAIKGPEQPPQPPQPPAPDTYTDPATGKTVAHGFLKEWLAAGGVRGPGHPVTNEQSGDSWPFKALPELKEYTCQLFEHDGYAWKAGSPVVHIRVGALALALALALSGMSQSEGPQPAGPAYPVDGLEQPHAGE